MTDLDALLRSVLDPHLHATESLVAWWDATAPQRSAWTTPIDRAIAGGACADRVGFAFAAGYAEALRALLPSAPQDSINALCASEEGGNHPRAIQTRLEPVDGGGYVLTGNKRWATMASAAQSLLVVASTGTDSTGKNRLRVVRVPAGAAGVRIEASVTPFVPEIPHARVTLDRVAVSEADLLPGDGYDDYLKPFRTIEDLHVHAALLGYLIAVARRHGFPHDTVERLLAITIATRALAAADPKSTTTHLALAGLLHLATECTTELEHLWQPGAERTRWDRDRVLLQVAGTARAARRDRAWTTFQR